MKLKTMKTSSKERQFEPIWPQLVDEDDPIGLPDEENRSSYISLSAGIIDAIRETYETPILVEQPLYLSSFHHFATLPAELRIQIWRSSLPGSRVVPIFYDESTKFAYSNCSIPPQLRVNHEARSIAREHYQLTFGIGNNPQTVWFDFREDEIYFGVGNITPTSVVEFLTEFVKIRSPDTQRLQKVTIDDDLMLREIHEIILRELSIETPRNLLLTIITRSGNSDAFLTEVHDNRGEYQAWSVCSGGRAYPLTPTLVPGDFVCWEYDLLNYWQAFERILWDARCDVKNLGSLHTVRWVSINRLSHIPAWKVRRSFLQEKIYVPEWHCLIPKSKGFYELLRELEDSYPTICNELSRAFAIQLAKVPSDYWGQGIEERVQDLLDLDLPQLMRNLIFRQAPCLCRTRHADIREAPKGLYTLRLLHYLKRWMVDEYLGAVAEYSSREEHIKLSPLLEDETILQLDNRSKSIGYILLDRTKKNMASAVRKGIRIIPKPGPTTRSQ